MGEAVSLPEVVSIGVFPTKKWRCLSGHERCVAFGLVKRRAVLAAVKTAARRSAVGRCAAQS